MYPARGGYIVNSSFPILAGILHPDHLLLLISITISISIAEAVDASNDSSERHANAGEPCRGIMHLPTRLHNDFIRDILRDVSIPCSGRAR